MLSTFAQLTVPADPNNIDTDLTGDGGLISTIINLLLSFVAGIAIIMIIIGGIRYIISNGDQNAVTGAKNTILYAIVGLIVAIFGFAIVNFVIDDVVQPDGDANASPVIIV